EGGAEAGGAADLGPAGSVRAGRGAEERLPRLAARAPRGEGRRAGDRRAGARGAGDARRRPDGGAPRVGRRIRSREEGREGADSQARRREEACGSGPQVARTELVLLRERAQCFQLRLKQELVDLAL